MPQASLAIGGKKHKTMSKKVICENDMMLFFLIKLEMMKRHDDFQDFLECREMGTHTFWRGGKYTLV